MTNNSEVGALIERVAMAIAQEIGWGTFSHFDPADVRRIAKAAVEATEVETLYSRVKELEKQVSGAPLRDGLDSADAPEPPSRLGPSGAIPSALNVHKELYLAEDGTVFPITNWFDPEGDECARNDAVSCVAGKGDRWFSLVIADFTEKPAQ